MGNEYQAAEAYVRRIRNVAKRQYAERYLAWTKGGQTGRAPDYGPELSYMAAQAVRLSIENALVYRS